MPKECSAGVFLFYLIDWVSKWLNGWLVNYFIHSFKLAGCFLQMPFVILLYYVGLVTSIITLMALFLLECLKWCQYLMVLIILWNVFVKFLNILAGIFPCILFLVIISEGCFCFHIQKLENWSQSSTLQNSERSFKVSDIYWEEGLS